MSTISELCGAFFDDETGPICTLPKGHDLHSCEMFEDEEHEHCEHYSDLDRNYITDTMSLKGRIHQLEQAVPEVMVRLARWATGIANSRSGFGGQMFTEWQCPLCDKEAVHANTAVPLFCEECSRAVRGLAKVSK